MPVAPAFDVGPVDGVTLDGDDGAKNRQRASPARGLGQSLGTQAISGSARRRSTNDETSWRVAGKPYWLWAFANQDLTHYLIDRSRGEPALRRFFVEEFQGTLVTDFRGAYNAVVCAARQGCLVHLLGESHSVDHHKKGGVRCQE